MVSKNKSLGFTLVELIVVITILAILGTIGFLSFGSYSADARDTKRKADMKNLQGALVTKKTQGANVLSFVTSDALNRVASPSLAGYAATAGTDYEAGTFNFASLDINSGEFSDPQGGAYRLGVTTRLSQKYQLVAKLENAGTPISYVVGDYVARSGSITVTAATTSFTVVITAPADYNKFKVGDNVGCNAGVATDSDVTAVSADGKTLTIDVQTTGAGCTGLFLGDLTTAAPEIAGLVDSYTAAAAIVNGSSANLPY